MGVSMTPILPLAVLATLMIIPFQTVQAESRLICARFNTDNPPENILRFWIRRQRDNILGPRTELKRPNFHAWGGKRSGESAHEDISKVLRRAFHAWGGKRSSSLQDMQNHEQLINSPQGKQVELNLPEDFRDVFRRAVHTWGGKRFFELQDMARRSNNEGGKHSELNAQVNDPEILQRAFHAWGGKRLNPSKSNIPEDFPEVVPKDFHAWAGMRFPDPPEDERFANLGSEAGHITSAGVQISDGSGIDKTNKGETKRDFGAWRGRQV